MSQPARSDSHERSIPPALTFEPREKSLELLQGRCLDLSPARRIERDREQLANLLDAASKTLGEPLLVAASKAAGLAASLALPLGERDGAARVLLSVLCPVVGIPLGGGEARRTRLLQRGAKRLLCELGRNHFG